jgi:peroxiredoxin
MFLKKDNANIKINIKIHSIIIHQKRLLQMKNILFVSLLSCFMLTAFCQAKKNGAAPELSLPATDSKTINLSDLKGKVVIVDFWASWCAPCRENNPHLTKLYNKYHDKGLEILSVSLDTNESNWKEAIVQDNLKWLQVNDNRGWNAQSAIAYNVEGIPSMFLVDKKGIIREINLFGWRLEDEVKSLLKKQ